MKHTEPPWIVIGDNAGNGCNIGIEVMDKGEKRQIVIARTVAVRAPWALHGHKPIEQAEAVANAHRLVAALNLYDTLAPPGDGCQVAT